MSKISYCSLEEAWGDSYKTKNNNAENNQKETVPKEIVHKEIVNNMVEYEKYRFNPINKVNNNNNEKVYSPFNESIEKKYLQDKINYLENEFKKYKNYYEDKKDENSYTEKFSNNEKEEENQLNNNNNTDIIDLILLIIIGLIVIFVMNSIFNMGKSIGAKNKV